VKDTPPEIEAKFHRMLMQRSGEQRLKMGCSMHATAQALIKASVSAKSPVAVKRALFLRFYSNDFEPEEREKILLALGKAAERKRIKATEVLDASKRTTRKPRDLADLSIVKSSGSGVVRDKTYRYGRKGSKAKRSGPAT
jgi:hypothetical protein